MVVGVVVVVVGAVVVAVVFAAVVLACSATLSVTVVDASVGALKETVPVVALDGIVSFALRIPTRKAVLDEFFNTVNSNLVLP